MENVVKNLLSEEIFIYHIILIGFTSNRNMSNQKITEN